MSAMPAPFDVSSPAPAPLRAGVLAHDQFVVAFGKSASLGVFTSEGSTPVRRNDRVLVQTSRGLEVGAVLGPASIRQARLLGASASGVLVRLLDPADQARLDQLADDEHRIYVAGRQWAQDNRLNLEILDVDLLFDGRHAILQFVGDDDANSATLAEFLEMQFTLTIRLENLALAKDDEHHDHEGCGKPDCGKTDGGGCSSCDTGGCSSCGSDKTDLREYFGHLRAKMEETNRIPLT